LIGNDDFSDRLFDFADRLGLTGSACSLPVATLALLSAARAS
jgi:hypothetical protein